MTAIRHRDASRPTVHCRLPGGHATTPWGLAIPTLCHRLYYLGWDSDNPFDFGTARRPDGIFQREEWIFQDLLISAIMSSFLKTLFSFNYFQSRDLCCNFDKSNQIVQSNDEESSDENRNRLQLISHDFYTVSCDFERFQAIAMTKKRFCLTPKNE